MKRPSPRNPRRLLVMLLLLLTGGALVNVAVAWGCAAWSVVPSAAELQSRSVDLVPGEFEYLVQVGWLDAPLSFPGQTTATSLRIMRSNAVGWTCKRLEIWWMMPGAHRFVPDYSAYLIEAGWPLRSVACAGYADTDEIFRGNHLHADWKWAVVPPDRFNAAKLGSLGDESYSRPFPVRPTWPGFAINTVFYAAVLWMLFAAPFAVRRTRRVKRGLCPACAYPAGESEVCTECGTPTSIRREYGDR